MKEKGLKTQGIGEHIGEENTQTIAEQHDPEIDTGAFLPEAQQVVTQRKPPVGHKGGESFRGEEVFGSCHFLPVPLFGMKDVLHLFNQQFTVVIHQDEAYRP